MSGSPAAVDDRRRLDQVARALGLSGAEVRPLAGGSRNRNYRLIHPAGDVVIRLEGAHDPDYAVVREAESRAQRAAAAAGLAPRVMLEDRAAGILVSEFVAGAVWSREHARSAAGAQRLGRWLARLHAVPSPAGLRIVDFVTSLGHYQTRLPAGRLPRGVMQRAASVREDLDGGAAAALCHNDLHHLNLIDSANGVLAVDWEYAGVGMPIMDLAGYAAYHDLDERASAALLSGYAGPAEEPSPQRLAQARWLFEAVWLAWLELALALDRSEPGALAAERQRLSSRVRQDS